ncbi:RNA polymerase sigma factor [Bacillus horti]|uniref:RNA polymerase sigma-70 factor (ECF subfamily) n=1 Tax=Caldalkalibacillus horti TaxID=77523 RepID=A0ABT9W0F4_9BACI|nr:RNA polymerase sigma factor [Bacillus horti]MDQ0166738.1 RNA polymerase sigma-70 factor (ECF subfamily) [Bacillus horti]
MSARKQEEVTEWYNEYSDAIFKFILMMTHDYQQAEDLTHETFIKAYRFHDSFNRNSSPKTWLYKIAHNVTIDALRMRKPILFIKTILQLIDPNPLPEEVVQIKEESRELYDALKRLKESYREVVILRKIKGFSTKETAEILHWSESKVKMTLSRAILALEKQLMREGYVNEKTV